MRLLATITTDTGALAPGHRDWSRYTTPGLCRAAALTSRHVLERSLATQAVRTRLRRTPERDTMPSEAVAIARACGARFTVANTAPVDLSDLFDLAVLEQNDSLARTALRRRVALAPTDSARRAVVTGAFTAFLEVEPARTAAAESVLAQLDARWPHALGLRLAARMELLTFADSTLDPARVRAAAERVVAFLHPVTGDSLKEYGWYALTHAYQSMMAMAFLYAPDSMPAIARSAQQELIRVPSTPQVTNTFVGASLKSVIEQLSPVHSEIVWHHGEKMLPVHAAAWFPAGDSAQPVSGKVNLLLAWRNFCTTYTIFTSDCTALDDKVRGWLQRYGPSNLSVTIVVPEQGHAVYSGPIPVQQQAQEWGWYFREYLHLPVTVAVQATPTHTVPFPAGRHVWLVDSIEFQQTYGYQPGQGLVNDDVVMTDRDGRVLYVGPVSLAFGALLGRTLAPVAAGAPSVPAAAARGGDSP